MACGSRTASPCTGIMWMSTGVDFAGTAPLRRVSSPGCGGMLLQSIPQCVLIWMTVCGGMRRILCVKSLPAFSLLQATCPTGRKIYSSPSPSPSCTFQLLRICVLGLQILGRTRQRRQQRQRRQRWVPHPHRKFPTGRIWELKSSSRRRRQRMGHLFCGRSMLFLCSQLMRKYLSPMTPAQLSALLGICWPPRA